MTLPVLPLVEVAGKVGTNSIGAYLANHGNLFPSFAISFVVIMSSGPRTASRFAGSRTRTPNRVGVVDDRTLRGLCPTQPRECGRGDAGTALHRSHPGRREESACALSVRSDGIPPPELFVEY